METFFILKSLRAGFRFGLCAEPKILPKIKSFRYQDSMRIINRMKKSTCDVIENAENYFRSFLFLIDLRMLFEDLFWATRYISIISRFMNIQRTQNEKLSDGVIGSISFHLAVTLHSMRQLVISALCGKWHLWFPKNFSPFRAAENENRKSFRQLFHLLAVHKLMRKNYSAQQRSRLH